MNNRNADLNKPENWVVGKRRGNKVRYRNKVTGAWDGWQRVIPHTVGDVVDFEFAQSEAAARKRHPTNRAIHVETPSEQPAKAFKGLSLVELSVDTEPGPFGGTVSVVDVDEYHPDFDEDIVEVALPSPTGDKLKGVHDIHGGPSDGVAALKEAMQGGADLAREQFPDYDIAKQPASGGIQEFTPSRTDELKKLTVKELVSYIRENIPKERHVPNLSKARKGTLVTIVTMWLEANDNDD